jgi:hypothetical protein
MTGKGAALLRHYKEIDEIEGEREKIRETLVRAKRGYNPGTDGTAARDEARQL